MKEEKSKLDIALGSIGLSAAIIVIFGIIIKIITANWAFFTKLIVLAAIVLTVILSYYKAKDEKKREKEFENLINKRHENRKPFQERVDELKKQMKP